jgi:hypothetical protein
MWLGQRDDSYLSCQNTAKDTSYCLELDQLSRLSSKIRDHFLMKASRSSFT